VWTRQFLVCSREGQLGGLGNRDEVQARYLLDVRVRMGEGSSTSCMGQGMLPFVRSLSHEDRQPQARLLGNGPKPSCSSLERMHRPKFNYYI